MSEDKLMTASFIRADCTNLDRSAVAEVLQRQARFRRAGSARARRSILLALGLWFPRIGLRILLR